MQSAESDGKSAQVTASGRCRQVTERQHGRKGRERGKPDVELTESRGSTDKQHCVAVRDSRATADRTRWEAAE